MTEIKEKCLHVKKMPEMDNSPWKAERIHKADLPQRLQHLLTSRFGLLFSRIARVWFLWYFIMKGLVNQTLHYNTKKSKLQKGDPEHNVIWQNFNFVVLSDEIIEYLLWKLFCGMCWKHDQEVYTSNERCYEKYIQYFHLYITIYRNINYIVNYINIHFPLWNMYVQRGWQSGYSPFVLRLRTFGTI